MKFETKCKKLGIEEEVKSIIENCECGEINSARIVEISKLRKWEINEIVGNYLDADDEQDVDWWNIKQLKTFCKVFGITEDEIPKYYAEAICEGGYEIAYPLESNKDVVLVLE